MNCHSQKLENSNVMVFEFCKKRIKSLHPSPHVFYLETCKGHLIDVRAPGCRNVVFYIVLKPYTRHKSCWRYSVQVSHRGQRSAGRWLSGGGLVPWQPICPSVLVSPGFWCFKCGVCNPARHEGSACALMSAMLRVCRRRKGLWRKVRSVRSLFIILSLGLEEAAARIKAR